MNTYTNKTSGNKSRAIANSLSQNQNKSESAAIAQRKPDVVQGRFNDGTASSAAELILDLREGTCNIYKDSQFTTVQDKKEDTFSEEYIIVYGSLNIKHYLHIHNGVDDQSEKIHVKDAPDGSKLYDINCTWAKFLELAKLASSFE